MNEKKQEEYEKILKKARMQENQAEVEKKR